VGAQRAPTHSKFGFSPTQNGRTDKNSLENALKSFSSVFICGEFVLKNALFRFRATSKRREIKKWPKSKTLQIPG
jgi:hypothetical protein